MSAADARTGAGERGQDGPGPDRVGAKTGAGTETGAASGLVRGLLRGEPRALARAITAVESDSEEAAGILAAIQPHLGNARIVGITGPPGAGKSTLTDAIITELRRRGKQVAVLAVDPSSPFTGGAILGDRIRMLGHADDEGVFVRSVASRGHLGGLFRNVAGVLQVMDASGPDVIIVETVGAGQSEVEITRFAETKVVVCAPGLGDDIQAMKAGILEIADILVVNKGDQPHAEDTVRQLRGMLHLRDPRLGSAVVVSTTATTGRGVPELVDVLEEPRLEGGAGG
jgi:LAO/AO transport system kinase